MQQWARRIQENSTEEDYNSCSHLGHLWASNTKNYANHKESWTREKVAA